MDDLTKDLQRLLYTLNQLQVQGRDNLDRLLGCIQTVERRIASLSGEQSGHGGGA